MLKNVLYALLFLHSSKHLSTEWRWTCYLECKIRSKHKRFLYNAEDLAELSLIKLLSLHSQFSKLGIGKKMHCFSTVQRLPGEIRKQSRKMQHCKRSKIRQSEYLPFIWKWFMIHPHDVSENCKAVHLLLMTQHSHSHLSTTKVNLPLTLFSVLKEQGHHVCFAMLRKHSITF